MSCVTEKLPDPHFMQCTSFRNFLNLKCFVKSVNNGPVDSQWLHCLGCETVSSNGSSDSQSSLSSIKNEHTQNYWTLLCRQKKKIHTTMTHFEASQWSEVGIKLSLDSGGGCNWLKNSSTCNIKFNQHLSITNTHTHTHTHTSLRRG